ncbi:MAG: hypothetical protein M3362_24865 [Acidobacteriota bacterium]|nr:hypothetical protein [Acidobacteriota bacterium]
MKKFIVASALLCVMMVAGLAAALPNYAGTWVLDKDKSTGLPPQMMSSTDAFQWTISQDTKTLTVKSAIMGGTQETPYNLDGSKSKVQVGGQMPGEATVYLEKKDDGKIVLHTERTVNVQGNDITIKRTQVLELADGGKTLKVKSTTESPRGTQELSLVFTLKS